MDQCKCVARLGRFHFKQTSTIQDAKNVKEVLGVFCSVNLNRVDVMYETSLCF